LHGPIPLHSPGLVDGREDEATVNWRWLLVDEGESGVDAGLGEAEAGLDARTVSPLPLLRAIASKVAGTPAS
jgi:hypothetical protein